jgi:hypothetical protein
MPNRSVEDILDSLIDATEEGKLTWEPSSPARAYVANLPRHRIRVWHWTSENENTEGVTVQLLEKSGDVIDYISADEYKPLFADLDRLYLGAMRSANNVSSVISEIEEELAALKVRR